MQIAELHAACCAADPCTKARAQLPRTGRYWTASLGAVDLATSSRATTTRHWHWALHYVPAQTEADAGTEAAPSDHLLLGQQWQEELHGEHADLARGGDGWASREADVREARVEAEMPKAPKPQAHAGPPGCAH